MNDLPPPRREIHLGCAGNRHALVVVNKRYVRWRCTQKRCKRQGFKTFHIADSLTGRLVRTEYEPTNGACDPPERS